MCNLELDPESEREIDINDILGTISIIWKVDYML